VVVDGAGLASAVSFTLARVRPPIGRRCGHVDYRTHVVDGGEAAVWFLGAAMDHPLAGVLRRLWGMPWHRAAVGIVDGDAYALDVAGAGGATTVRAESGGEIDPAAATLTAPLLGVYAGRGGVRRYRVEHPRLQVRPAKAEAARVELFERAGVVDAGQPARSVLLVDDFTIRIAFPPR
jgi:hypothetical protein